jgi:hypothetical protein
MMLCRGVGTEPSRVVWKEEKFVSELRKNAWKSFELPEPLRSIVKLIEGIRCLSSA